MMGAVAGAGILSLEDPRAFRSKMSSSRNRGLLFDLIRLYAVALDPSLTSAQHRHHAALYLQGRNAEAMALGREGLRRFFGEARGGAIQDRVDDYLLYERNTVFIKTALPELNKGGLLIAIGSWHLPGENGMVAMLIREGLAVTRIVLPQEATE